MLYFECNYAVFVGTCGQHVGEVWGNPVDCLIGVVPDIRPADLYPENGPP